MSMSIIGLESRPGMEVLPMCSMVRNSTPAAVRRVLRWALAARKVCDQVGSWGRRIMPGEDILRRGDEWEWWS